MEEIRILAESCIKIEIKEELVDMKEEYCWDSIVENKSRVLQPSVKEDDGADDKELELPIAVFITPMEKEESACMDETKDPLAPSFSECTSIKQKEDLECPDGELNCLGCTLWKEALAQRERLQAHMHMHIDEKPFECCICPTRFTESGLLRKHIHVHTDVKPLKCSVCWKSFTYRANLRTHMRMHTGDKSFQCSICQKKFSARTHLRVHMQEHTSEKPFKCPKCKKSFTQKQSWKYHIYTHW